MTLNQISFTTSRGEFLLWEVPYPSNPNEHFSLDKFISKLSKEIGKFKIICGTNGITEEQAESIVDVKQDDIFSELYLDYRHVQRHIWFFTALESSNSLLISLKADKDKDYIILKKNQ